MTVLAVALVGTALYVGTTLADHDSISCSGGNSRSVGCTTMAASATTVLLGLAATVGAVAAARWRTVADAARARRR